MVSNPKTYLSSFLRNIIVSEKLQIDISTLKLIFIPSPNIDFQLPKIVTSDAARLKKDSFASA